jgi:(2S)-methylsuccinyl-CoA dehydrogenase
MQAAYEDARQYALDRAVFGQPIAEYQLTQAKLGRMAVTIQAARQFSYQVARSWPRARAPSRRRW